jgi:hypothetical protein
MNLLSSRLVTGGIFSNEMRREPANVSRSKKKGNPEKTGFRF